MDLIGQSSQPTHVLVVQPIGQAQVSIPFHSEEDALVAAETAIASGVLRVSPAKEGERWLFIQTGPGTIYLVLTAQDANRAVMQARLAQGMPVARG